MNRILLAELVDESDLVIHFAAAVGVRLIVESPVHTIETNVKGTELVLQAAQKKEEDGPGRFHFGSLWEEHGDSFSRGWRPGHGRDKQRALELRSFKSSGRVPRPGLLPREKTAGDCFTIFQYDRSAPNRTLRHGGAKFCAPGHGGKPITVFGDGKQSRCFCHVGDVIQALLKLVVNPKAVGEVFNIGSTEEITIEDLAKLVKRRVNSNSEIRYIPYEQAYEEGFEDMFRRVPSIEKIYKCIGWRASTPLDATIDSIAHYFEERDKQVTSGIVSGSAEVVA